MHFSSTLQRILIFHHGSRDFYAICLANCFFDQLFFAAGKFPVLLLLLMLMLLLYVAIVFFALSLLWITCVKVLLESHAHCFRQVTIQHTHKTGFLNLFLYTVHFVTGNERKPKGALDDREERKSLSAICSCKSTLVDGCRLTSFPHSIRSSSLWLHNFCNNAHHWARLI